MEPYVTDTKDKLHRQALCKLRLSAHNLHIEKGRHKQIPRENRKCSLCDVVKDETHFLDDCKKFENERKQYIDTIKKNFSDKITKHISIVKPSQTLLIDECQECLAKYVYKCFNQ